MRPTKLVIPVLGFIVSPSPFLAQAQDPVPVHGGNALTAQVPIRLVTKGGVPLAHVMVELLNTSGQVVGEGTTDSRGEYRFKKVAPQNYKLRILFEGFKSMSFPLSVGFDQSATFTFSPEGPVPVGDSVPPKNLVGESPKEMNDGVQIEEIQEEGKATLQDRLDRETKQGKRLVNLISLGSKRSLLVFKNTGDPKNQKLLVLLVEKPLSVKEIKSIIDTLTAVQFIGIHWSGESSFLMVFAYE